MGKRWNVLCFTAGQNDHEDPYPSLSDYHDYEPNLEFDDTELQQASAPGGKSSMTSLALLLSPRKLLH